MIIKNTFKIHYLFYLVAFICIITGFFKSFVLISLLIIIHELGHFLTAVYFKWHIDKVIIFPFGGVTIFKEHLNKPLKEEFLILIMGPIFQIGFYFLSTNIFGPNPLLTKYHYALLIFNLLPIFPLDGSKLITLLLEKYLPFKISHLLNLMISFIFLFIILVIVLVNNWNLILLFWLFLLLTKVITELYLHEDIFNKFLMERYLYDFQFKKNKIMNNCKINNMYRDRKHLFFKNGKYLTERFILQKKFDFKRKI